MKIQVHLFNGIHYKCSSKLISLNDSISIKNPPVLFNIQKAQLEGESIIYSEKTIHQMQHIFHDEVARLSMNQETVVYNVQAYLPIEEGIEGGLFFGTTTIFPGMVNDEYFMTHGHFHKERNRGEFYMGIEGEGVLLMMGRDRKMHTEFITKGSIHYVPGHTAHRVANTGHTNLVFNACWPSDAGHDYAEIVQNGFSYRLVNKNGQPQLMKNF